MSDTPINNGGPAFPVAWSLCADGRPHSCPEVWGMSLRDWFAGQALSGILAGRKMSLDKAEPGSEHHMSESAYIIADAMLAARGVKS